MPQSINPSSLSGLRPRQSQAGNRLLSTIFGHPPLDLHVYPAPADVRESFPAYFGSSSSFVFPKAPLLGPPHSKRPELLAFDASTPLYTFYFDSRQTLSLTRYHKQLQ